MFMSVVRWMGWTQESRWHLFTRRCLWESELIELVVTIRQDKDGNGSGDSRWSWCWCLWYNGFGNQRPQLSGGRWCEIDEMDSKIRDNNCSWEDAWESNLIAAVTDWVGGDDNKIRQRFGQRRIVESYNCGILVAKSRLWSSRNR